MAKKLGYGIFFPYLWNRICTPAHALRQVLSQLIIILLTSRLMEDKNLTIPAEYADICPISDKDFHNEMSILIQEPAFKHILRLVLPDLNYSQIVSTLQSLNSKHDLQMKVMKPFIDGLLARTSKGLTVSGFDDIKKDVPYVHITNHRDIVLDSALLSYNLVANGYNTVEIAIGNNLLIYDWINKLVRLNKCFIVKRNLGRLQTMAAAIQLSGYIRYVITQKKNSVWIAQREGRCKDSNDRTQESLLKMLSYGDRSKSFVGSIKDLNLAPIAISYEYDPNDYLKAKEFLLKSKNPNYKKSQEDDLLSMKTGILGYKGHIHYAFSPCINDELDKIPADLDKLLTVRVVCQVIDRTIHTHYKIFKTNYMAHDMLFDNQDFADRYSPKEKTAFADYLNSQIDKSGLQLNELDRNYMFKKMLEMYSNPLTNQLEALK